MSASSGRGVFDGNVKVEQLAQQTDAAQLSRNLLLVPKGKTSSWGVPLPWDPPLAASEQMHARSCKYKAAGLDHGLLEHSSRIAREWGPDALWRESLKGLPGTAGLTAYQLRRLLCLQPL